MWVKLKSAKLVLKAVLVLFFGLSAPSAMADKDVEAQVQSILQGMTLEQKVGQMIQGEIKWVTPEDVTKYHLGSVLNGGGSFPHRNKASSVDDWLQLADSYYSCFSGSQWRRCRYPTGLGYRCGSWTQQCDRSHPVST